MHMEPWSSRTLIRRGRHLRSPSQEMGPHENLIILAPWSQASSLQNCKKTNFFCLSQPVYGILLWQLSLLIQVLHMFFRTIRWGIKPFVYVEKNKNMCIIYLIHTLVYEQLQSRSSVPWSISSTWPVSEPQQLLRKGEKGEKAECLIESHRTAVQRVTCQTWHKSLKYCLL